MAKNICLFGPHFSNFEEIREKRFLFILASFHRSVLKSSTLDNICGINGSDSTSGDHPSVDTILHFR